MNKDGTLEELLGALFQKKNWEKLKSKLSARTKIYICSFLEQAAKKMEKFLEQKEKPERVSGLISYVLEFCNCLEGGGIYQESFFHTITESQVLRTLMLEVRNEEYLAMCRQAFALEEKCACESNL